MSGKSSTPLATKLGIKTGHRVELIGTTQSWAIEDLPEDVQVGYRRSGSPANVVVAFFNDAATLSREINALSSSLTVDGILWIAWPRRVAGHESDITDNIIRNLVLPIGLVDTKVAAIDHDWSALKFVWRKKLRADLR
jgi:hypothetical protein